MATAALAWIAAIGALVAAIGAWRTEATARWQARADDPGPQPAGFGCAGAAEAYRHYAQFLAIRYATAYRTGEGVPFPWGN